MIYEPIDEPDSWRPEIEENVNIYLEFSKQNEHLTSMTGELWYSFCMMNIIENLCRSHYWSGFRD